MLTRKSVRNVTSTNRQQPPRQNDEDLTNPTNRARAPLTITSRGGNLLSLYFTRSFKRRKRTGHEERQAAYKKGDLSTRREPSFGLAKENSGQAARSAAFSEALQNLRGD